ncbi:hypothetical protein [Anaplasma phagocytophilum]|nr:hypothetical protein [Anaplasma phagocytophilum]
MMLQLMMLGALLAKPTIMWKEYKKQLGIVYCKNAKDMVPP